MIPFDFYPETEWRDDLELGATELAFALAAGGLPAGLPHTDPRFYLRAAAHWANAYITGPNDAADTLNLYDVSGLAHYELVPRHRAGRRPAPGSQIDAGGAARRPEEAARPRPSAQGATDPFGFGFPWAQCDTTSHGAGLAVRRASTTS